VGWGEGKGGEMMGAMQIMYNISLIRIVTTTPLPPYNEHILKKKKRKILRTQVHRVH
jgi:hypothetical protein